MQQSIKAKHVGKQNNINMKQAYKVKAVVSQAQMIAHLL